MIRFRLIVCQLQTLRKVPLESDIRQALKELPNTLDTTYERIIAGIPGEWQALVIRATSLLIFVPSVPADVLMSFLAAADGEAQLLDDEPNLEAF
jgi:hypothetical protein